MEEIRNNNLRKSPHHKSLHFNLDPTLTVSYVIQTLILHPNFYFVSYQSPPFLREMTESSSLVKVLIAEGRISIFPRVWLVGGSLGHSCRCVMLTAAVGSDAS